MPAVVLSLSAVLLLMDGRGGRLVAHPPSASSLFAVSFPPSVSPERKVSPLCMELLNCIPTPGWAAEGLPWSCRPCSKGDSLPSPETTVVVAMNWGLFLPLAAGSRCEPNSGLLASREAAVPVDVLGCEESTLGMVCCVVRTVSSEGPGRGLSPAPVVWGADGLTGVPGIRVMNGTGGCLGRLGEPVVWERTDD